MRAPLRFIYQYPEVTGTDAHLLDAGSVTELAIAVEAAGWHGFAFTEHPAPGQRWLAAGGHQALDPFVALAAVAAVTERLRLLTYLSVLPYRNPLLLAKSASTLDLISSGRFILGVGTGYLKGEFRALGVDFDERNRLFDEALDVLPLAWSGQPFSYDGSHFTAKDTTCLPPSVQQPIPIWIGGNSPLSKRRVASRAQGWMPLISSPELASTTRTPALSIGDDLEAAITELREDALSQGRDVDVTVPYLDSTVFDDSPDLPRHRDALDRLHQIGVDWVAFPARTLTAADSVLWIKRIGESLLA